MPKILKSQIEKDLTLAIDAFADVAEYEDYKDRITSQLLKTVEVQGFRKGKAPTHLAVEKIDPIKLQQTVYQESIARFFNELDPEVKEILSKEKRVATNSVATLDPEFTKEEEGGFKFRVYVNLLPEVDLELISNFKIAEPKESEIKGRLTKEEFFTREKEAFLRSLNVYEDTEEKTTEESQLMVDIQESVAGQENSLRETKDGTITLSSKQFPKGFVEQLIGLKTAEVKKFSLSVDTEAGKKQKMDFEVTINKIRLPKYKTLIELFENSDEAKKQFKTLADFDIFLTNIYTTETTQILDSLKRQSVIKALVEDLPNFPLPQDQIADEVERILNVLQERAITSKQSLMQVFASSGLPDADKNASSEEEVRKFVKGYITKEFKLVDILRVVYNTKVEEKMTDKDVEFLAKEIIKDPTKYEIADAANLTEDRSKDIAYDRLLRARSFKWILEQVKEKEKK